MANGISPALQQARKEIEGLQAKLVRTEASLKYANDRADQSRRELESMHDLLDTLGAVPRRKEGDYNDRPAMMRLTAYLAGVRARHPAQEACTTGNW